MTENVESAAGSDRRKDAKAPGLDGEGGQYTDGDYGDAGVVETEETGAKDGEYPDGDYGDAGTAGTAREVEVDEDKNS